MSEESDISMRLGSCLYWIGIPLDKLSFQTSINPLLHAHWYRDERLNDVYSITMDILAGLLLIGFVCTSLIRPVDERLFTAADSPATSARKPAAAMPAGPTPGAAPSTPPGRRLWGEWLAVSIPIACGVKVTLEKAIVLFH